MTRSRCTPVARTTDGSAVLTAELNLFLAVGVAIALWQWAGRGREAADGAARRVCDELGVQRLDGAVALSSMRLQSTASRLRLVRIYRFEYSVAGVERNDGEIALVSARPGWARLHDGETVVHIDLA